MQVIDDCRLKIIEIVICGAVIVLLVAGAYYRNQIWRSAESLWSDNLKKSPEKGRVKINYAAEMIKQGRFEEAIYELKEMLKNDPHSAEAMNNLAMSYMLQGRTEEAEKMLFHAIKICGSSKREIGIKASAHNNLGIIMVKKGAWAEAMIQFEKAINLDQNLVEAKTNLSIIQERTLEREFQIKKGGRENGKGKN